MATSILQPNCSLNANSNLATSNHLSRKEPFKATRIWNEVLHAFYLGIEIRQHRRKMKTYHDCFTAAEGVTWLKAYLRQCTHFNGNKITRFQALNLLRKYYKSNLIERVKPSKNDKEIQDNNELYRFTIDANENLPCLPTSKSESDLLESCAMVDPEKPVELDLREKVDIYKRTMWAHMNKLLLNISDYIKAENIDGSSLFYNVTRVNTNGVVQVIDKNQDLPHWVMSAMKCLANWPRASGSGNCLPKYPGFEFDVFNLIREYFTNIEEPIIPYKFYKLLMIVFEHYLEALSLNKKKYSTFSKYKSTTLSKSRASSYNYNNELNLPSNCVYETVFSSRDPVTKIVPIDELCGVFPNLVDYFKQNVFDGSRPSNSTSQVAQCMSPATPNSTFNATSTIPSQVSRAKMFENYTPSTIMNESNTSKYSSKEFSLESPPETGEYMMNKNVGFNRFYSLRKNKNGRDRSSMSSITYPKNQFYELMQLVLLLLPCSSRRQLHLLIRLFYRIIRNKELCLLTKDSLALKEHIVTIFTRSIINADKEKDYDEFKAKEFVNFLIDDCMEIFNVPEDFTKDVQKMMDDLKKSKAELKETTFCQKISNDEYEIQRDVFSEMALSELLESIMRDDSLSERDKLKWIKQFKMYHPDVYDIYFANCNSRVSTENTQRNSRNPIAEVASNRSRSLGSTLIPSGNFVKRFLSLKL